MDLPDLPALEPNSNIHLIHPVLALLHLLPMRLFTFPGRLQSFLAPSSLHQLPSPFAHIPRTPDNHGESARAPAKLRLAPSLQPHIKHQRPRRHHPERKTIPPPHRLRGYHPRIRAAPQTLNQLVGDARPETLDRLPRPHALRRDDITLLLRLIVRHQREMCRPARIVLDTLDRMAARGIAVEIHDPDAAFGAPAAVADRDAAGVVPAAEVLAFAGEG
ncbi:MAG: hypothetical protein Q9196_005656 [Gyalolechia fulgens]